MYWDNDIIESAVEFLLNGDEKEAANVLRSCRFEGSDVVDYWMDGSTQLEGLSFELGCPRQTYEILSKYRHPITTSIEKALNAVLPSGFYLKNIRPRFDKTISISQKESINSGLTSSEINNLINKIEEQKELMINVSTGRGMIQEVNKQYIELNNEIKTQLHQLGIDDPNPYTDLWKWYDKWRDGSLPTYQSRRNYIIDLFQPLLETLLSKQFSTNQIHQKEPTGWTRVDRNVDKIISALATAKNEEDFQSVGLLCREAIISLAQAVYKPKLHGTPNGIKPSNTDAKRMLEGFLAVELAGSSNETKRKLVKTTLQLASGLQHQRTAQFRDAALCAEGTRSIINIIAIISGRRDPL